MYYLCKKKMRYILLLSFMFITTFVFGQDKVRRIYTSTIAMCDTIFVFNSVEERSVFIDSLGYFGCDCFLIPYKYYSEYGSLQVGFLQKSYNIETPKKTGETLLNFTCDNRELQAIYNTVIDDHLIVRFIRWRYDCINNKFYINSNVVKRIELP